MISEPEILFEDDSIVAAVKPFGATSESGPFIVHQLSSPASSKI